MKMIFKLWIIIFTFLLFIPLVSNASYIKLLENDFIIINNDKACFSYISSCDKLKIFVNEIFFKEVESSERKENKVCISLEEANNYKIEAFCNYASVYFFVNSSNYTCETSQEKVKIIEIEIENNTKQYENIELKLIVKNFGCKGKVSILKIFVNNNSIEESRVLLKPNETKEIKRNIKLLDYGKNKLSVEIDEDSREKEIYVEKRALSIFPFLLIFLIFNFIILFKSYEKFISLNIFLSFFISSIVFLGYLFDKLSIYLFSFQTSFILFLFTYFFLLILVKFIFKKIENRKIEKLKVEAKKDFILFLASFTFILLFTLLPKLLVKTQNTYWNVFYERQVRETFYNGLVPRFDDLSYFGREMSYPPGYFILKSYLLWLFNLNYSYYSDIILEIFFNAITVFSLIYLTKNLKGNYSQISRLIFILSFCSFVFIFTLLSAHLLHVPSIALLFYSLAIILEKNLSKNSKILLSSFLLFSASLIHPYALILYFAFYIFFILISEIKFDLNFLIPIFISYLPFIGKGYSTNNVAFASQWGWFLKGEFIGMIKEFSFLLIIVLGILSFDIFEIFIRKRRLTEIRKRRLTAEILLILSLAAYSVLSFRVNILVCFLISFILMDFINKIYNKEYEACKNRLYLSSILFFVFVNYFYSIYEISYGNNIGGYIDEKTLSAIENLGSNGYFIKSDEKVIADAFLGHAIAFISGKKVLADLYVEYANETKLKDAIEFSTKNNFSIADKYNINKALTKYSCRDWNKIYDNLAYNICERFES